VSLCSDRREPVLAWWQYGAGKVAAWTSDVQGGWTGSFLSWEEAPAFFAGILSYILPVNTRSGDAEMEDGKLRFTADAEDELMSRAAKAEARIIRPDGTQETVELGQVSARVFEGEADTSQAGAYAVHVSVRDRLGNELLAADSGAVLSWSREYDLRTAEEGILEQLSAETGGITTENPAELLNFRDTSARKRRDLTWVLALLAGLIFLFDVAQRRLDWLREPEKKEKPEEEEREKPVKPAKKKPEKKQLEKPQEKAADVLWENLQKKKRL
jgi:hypothetical protein